MTVTLSSVRALEGVEVEAVDQALLAHLAGVLELAGTLSIKRWAHDFRGQGSVNLTYTERIAVKQVDAIGPTLFKKAFGGTLIVEKPATRPNSNPVYRYEATDRRAARIVAALLPYLRQKREQAQVLLEFRRWKDMAQARRYVWWWLQAHPDWQRLPMLTTSQVAQRLGYRRPAAVKEALYDGLLVALPTVVRGRRVVRRFPESLVRGLARMRRNQNGAHPANLPQLIRRFEGLLRRIQALNRRSRRQKLRQGRVPHEGPC